MRVSAKWFAAGLVLTLCAGAGTAFAADAAGTPSAAAASGVPEAPTASSSKVDDTSWGVLLRGGYFGLPNFIADELFYQHPDIAGTSLGVEFRYHGEGGGRGVTSIGLGVEYATATAKGDWQQEESDEVTYEEGEVEMLAFTLTGYWSLFPSWYVHPYVGLGIGVAHATGYYVDPEERKDADYWVPVLHVPIGLAVELGKTFQLAVEGRFIDGIAIGGALQVRF